jgi:hypothetical protein
MGEAKYEGDGGKWDKFLRYAVEWQNLKKVVRDGSSLPMWIFVVMVTVVGTGGG